MSRLLHLFFFIEGLLLETVYGGGAADGEALRMSGIPDGAGADKSACAASWLCVWLLSWFAAAVFCEFIWAITSCRSSWICWTWASAISLLTCTACRLPTAVWFLTSSICSVACSP